MEAKKVRISYEMLSHNRTYSNTITELLEGAYSQGVYKQLCGVDIFPTATELHQGLGGYIGSL